MIEHIYVDGVQVDNDKCFLLSIKDGGGAEMDVNTYARGGRSGVALGMPFYRGFTLSVEIVVVGDSFSDLVTQRDRISTFFRLKSDKSLSNQTKRFGVSLSDGTVKEVPVIFGPLRSNIEADEKLQSTFLITARSEREYFSSGADQTQDIHIYDAGGMGIVMGIPMDMSASPAQLTIPILNAGNAEYFPTVRLYGALDGFDLSNDTTDKTISYSTSLVIGHYLDLDFYNHTAVLDGNTNKLAYITGDWWWLEPGYNLIKLITTTGAGYATITYRDAFRGI